MDSQLPAFFDLIVVGTGFPESVISAAASRVGKSVLHIDKDEFYGGQWASFNLGQFLNLPTIIKNENDCLIGNNFFNIENYVSKWHCSELAARRIDTKEDKNVNETSDGLSHGEQGVKEHMDDSDEQDKQTHSENNIYTQEHMLKESRRFNIDLTPKLHFARGEYVELLISSNIARYSEYRSVSRVLTWLNGNLEVVPCSRSDVFSNNKVTVIEKRMLMKLLTSLEENSDALKGYENKTFLQYLKDKKLTPNIIHYVLYALSMSTDDTPCLEGIERTKKFVHNLGRFGKTPFLFSMYGSGEAPQAFCRLSAVFGGTYALSQPLKDITINENKFISITSGAQEIKANHLVLNIQKSPESLIKLMGTKKYISRAVFITDKSIMASEKEHLTLLLYPSENGKEPVTVIEMGCLTGTCPIGYHLVHFVSRQIDTPENDFQHIVSNLFNIKEEESDINIKPRILWSCYFSLPDTKESEIEFNLPENVFICDGPDMDLDFDSSIKRAREIFETLYPTEDFLPRAPDPEEIIIEGENTENDAGGFESPKDNSEENVNETEVTKPENSSGAGN